jgi:hypothetical protein
MDADVRFGQIALSHDLITKKQHAEAWKVLKDLRRKAKGKRGKKGKTPRLVDILVKKKHLTGRQAKSLENARLYQQARLEDKLYARIVLKSKFSKPKRVEKGLDAQRESYLEGDDLIRLSEFLLDKNYITEEQDEAIQEALGKLDVDKYMGGKKGSGSDSGSGSGSDSEVDLDVDESDDLGSDEGSAIDLDSDDELDSGSGSGSDDGVEELDLDSLDDGSGSDLDLDDAASMDELDSKIDSALSGIDEDELDLDSDSAPANSDSSDDPPPHGLSSDDLGSDDDLDLDDDGDDDIGSLSDDLGSGISLDSEDVAAASGRAPKAKAPSGSSDFDLSDIDLDDD